MNVCVILWDFVDICLNIQLLENAIPPPLLLSVFLKYSQLDSSKSSKSVLKKS